MMDNIQWIYQMDIGPGVRATEGRLIEFLLGSLLGFSPRIGVQNGRKGIRFIMKLLFYCLQLPTLKWKGTTLIRALRQER